jgi:hypothetical protein
VLDNCHQVRNLGEYEGDLNINGGAGVGSTRWRTNMSL